MKKLYKILMAIFIILLGSSGVLFGCGDKYKNLKISTNLTENVVEVFVGDDELSNTFSFVATVEGAGNDVSTNLKYNLEDRSLVTVDIANAQIPSSKNITITASNVNFGETDLTLLTEEGNKSLKIHIIVTYALQDITYNSSFKPFATIGATTRINTAKCLNFEPMETTQKDVFYEMLSANPDVEVKENGDIVVGEDAQNGSILVRATSKNNPSISTEFEVKILRGVDEIVVKDNEDVVGDKTLKFFNNRNADSLKILMIDPQGIDQDDYFFDYEIVEKSSNNKTDIFECETLNDNKTVALTALKTGQARLKIVAKLEGYDYVSNPFYVDLKSAEAPSSVTISSSQDINNFTVFDSYQNGLGEAVRVFVGGANAEDRRFVVSFAGEDQGKIRIIYGNREVQFEPDGDNFTSTDIFPNGSTLYLIASGDISDLSQITLSFVAYGSLSAFEAPTQRDVLVNLKHGVTELLTEENRFVDRTIMVPIQQQNETSRIIISTRLGQWTDAIFTEFKNDGLVFEKSSVSFEDSVINSNLTTRDYVFDVVGVKEGVYYVNFYTQNGRFVDVIIRVFAKVTEMTITTETIEQNSDIGEISYINSPLKTIDRMTIKHRGNVHLSINAYNNSNLQNCTLKNVKYSFDDSAMNGGQIDTSNYEDNSDYVKIDSLNNVLGYQVCDKYIKVKVVVTVFDDENTSGERDFVFVLNIKVYVALQSVSLSATNAVIYTKDTLSSFVGSDGLTEKQRYGEFVFTVKINPEKTEISEVDNIKLRWSGSEIGDSSSIEDDPDNQRSFVYGTSFDPETNIYTIKVVSNHLSNPLRSEGNVKFTITVIHFERTIVKEANIIVKKAVKIKDFYNISKVQDGVETLVEKRNSSLYLYFDARNMNGSQGTEFTLKAQTNPQEVFNSNLILIADSNNDVISVENNVVSINKPGITRIYVCAQDSYNHIDGEEEDYLENKRNKDYYSVKKTIEIKVADGLTKATSLEISKYEDLISINNNVESLSKFYSVTKSFNIASKTWTPIGMINGQLFPFTGNIDGLIVDEFGESSAVISGINFNGVSIDINEEAKFGYCGLFAKIGSTALVENLDIKISSVNISQTNTTITTYFGGIAGINEGEIHNCSVEFLNSGNNVDVDVNIADLSKSLLFGGIAGKNAVTVISNNSSNAIYAKISNCHASGYINISKTVNNNITYNIGGIVGANDGIIKSNVSFFNNAEIDDSYTSTIYIVVSQKNSTDQLVGVGGIAGKNTYEISNVSFDGKIVARDNVGGIVGYDNAGQISHAVSSGFVKGNVNVGGLVGKANDTSEAASTKISYSSVVIYDTRVVESSNIIGSNFVGGLVGRFEGKNASDPSTITYSYIRSYIKDNRENFVGDLYCQTINAHIGGIAGYAENIKFDRVYSKIKINAQNATIGGIIGYAGSFELKNLYEQNKFVGSKTGLIAGEVKDGTINFAQFFYSSHSSATYPLFKETGTNTTFNNSDLLDGQNIQNVKGWNSIYVQGISTGALAGTDWYLPENMDYPYLLYVSNNQTKAMAIEAPTDIVVKAKENINLKVLEKDNVALENTFVLFKRNISTIKFADLFDVSVEPNDEVLNISKAYTLTSSDSSIVQIVGKNQAEYKLKLASTGVVNLTIISKLDADISKTITLYIINAVKDFNISTTQTSTIVGQTQELKISMAQNYSNNNNFYIRIGNNNEGQLFVNGDNSSTVLVKNNAKLFVGASKSGNFTISYTLFVKIEIDGVEYYIDLPNDTGSSLDKINGSVSLNFIYGIKSFDVDAKSVEMGLNDTAYITYTLTGDNLRMIVPVENEDNISKLPNFEWNLLDEDGMNIKNGPWNIKLNRANIYASEGDNPAVVLFTQKDSTDGNKIDDYVISSGNINFNYTIVKIEFVLKITANSAINFNNASNLSLDLIGRVSLDESLSENSLDDRIAQSTSTELTINRQKIDNIRLDFYTNAEKLLEGGVVAGYTVNETPSNAIIAGQEGLLKIGISPINAEVKDVKISYESTNGYSLSMRQVLKNLAVDYSSDSSDENTQLKNMYIDKKPYAIAINNGRGLQLYHKESTYNVVENVEKIEYDGYLYVLFLIPSSVPAGSVFNVTVEAHYANGGLYKQNVQIVSKAHSEINIKYNFNGSIVNDYAYIARDVEKEFYVDFVEFVDSIDVNNLQNKYSPSAVFSVGNEQYSSSNENIRIEFARAVNINNSNSSYRIYYKIKALNLGKYGLSISLTKIDNNIQTTFKSNNFTFECVPFVVTGIRIVDSESDTLVIPQNAPSTLYVELDIECSEFVDTESATANQLLREYIKTKESDYDGSGYTSIDYVINKKDAIANNVIYLQREIQSKIECWFGTKQNADLPTTFVTEDVYANYRVDLNEQKYIRLSVKQLGTTDIIYCEVPLDYSRKTGESAMVELASNNSSYIGENNVGIKKIGQNDYIQYVRDSVKLELIRDVSSEFPTPITSQEEFLDMKGGANGEVIAYALDNDIVLEDYVPIDLTNISLDGNMHTITIKNFKPVQVENSVITYNTNLALFGTISENSILKNLTVNIDGLVDTTDEEYRMFALVTDGNETAKIDTTLFDISSFNFAAVCLTNNGIIYNVSAQSCKSTSENGSETIKENELNFVNTITNQVSISGFVLTNNGYISFSKSSIAFTANCGDIAGFAVTNSKNISASKVIIDGSITNTLTTSENSSTAGFVNKNRGKISTCYISGISDDAEKAEIISRATVGAFAMTNSGTIQNSYANVTTDSTSRSSGFVFENSGTIQSSYSSSKVITTSSAHTPFIGINERDAYNNTGTIDDCYYIDRNAQYNSVADLENVEKLSSDNYKSKTSFKKFVFAADKNDLSGTWIMNEGEAPHLVDADLEIYSRQTFVGVILAEDGITSHYNWEYKENSETDNATITSGSKRDINNKTQYNPRTITSIEDWNKMITADNNSNYFVILKDLTFNNSFAANSSKITFEGTLLGNNMQIKSLYLRTSATDTSKNYGLFAFVNGATIKDLSILTKQVMATNANCVGTLAGYIKGSKISNIAVDATDVVVQGKNMVGVFAGLINNSTITNISATGNVNAGYRDASTSLYNYLSGDLDTLTNDKNSNQDYAPYSYSGVFAGAVVGTSNVKLVTVTGENKVVGNYVGAITGLVDEKSTLSLATAKIVVDSYVRAFGIAGGLVAENRGTLDRCSIANEDNVQRLIDSNTNNSSTITGRNMTYFAGSPKFAGGLVGFNNGGAIQNSYSKIDVRISNYVTKASGGLVGLDVGGRIECCYATGSVTNRFIIGGLIGVVTNKETLLGSTLTTGTDEGTRNDSEYIFATNYYYKEGKIETTNNEKRSAFVAGKAGDDELEDNLLNLKNNLASNKWLLSNTGMTDTTMLSNAISGLLIGSVVDHQAKNTAPQKDIDEYGHKEFSYANIFAKETYNSDDSYFCDTNNYINTQVLKGKVTTTRQTIILSEILKSFVEYSTTLKINDMSYDAYYSLVDEYNVKTNLLNAIENASIGAKADSITLISTDDTQGTSIEEIPTNIAKCTINNALISFENLLNVDDIILGLNAENGLFKNYEESKFVLPNKAVRASMYYPEIIVNINLD